MRKMDGRLSRSAEEELYCICRKPYSDGEFMIECDKCHDWFHGSCVSVEEYQAQDIDVYHCPSCQRLFGPLVLKKRRNTQRHNYRELNDGIRPLQAGTIDFIRHLKARKFAERKHPHCREDNKGGSLNDVLIKVGSGSQLTPQFLLDCGFSKPILVKKKAGLGLTVPDADFTVFDVEQHVGSMTEIHVIDVSRQEDLRMKMREWTEYYNCPVRTKVLNVISLEFSKTELSKLVHAPTVVRKISWVENVWPSTISEEHPHAMPYVQKYCLMGVKDSYTDFHIDFGGTSVWYHVLRGEKVFYIVEPTDENLKAYEKWVSSADQSQVFFGDRVKKCFKCSVKQGQTLFIPTGWIHAVLTPVDSLVFGGNFLHSYSIGSQLKIYDLEKVLATPIKFLFPNYETTCWYAARAILRNMKDVHMEGRKIPSLLLTSVSDLLKALKRWTARKEEFVKFHKFQVPEEINFAKLIKAIEKEVKNDTKMKGTCLESSRPLELDVQAQEKETKGEKKTVLKLKLNVADANVVSQERLAEDNEKIDGLQLKKKKKKDEADGLKVTINKGLGKPEIKQVRQKPDSPNKTVKKSLKVKVSNGKIVSDLGTAVSPSDKFQPLVTSPEKPKEEVVPDDKLRLRLVGGEITYQHIPGQTLSAPIDKASTKGVFGRPLGAALPSISSQERLQPQASLDTLLSTASVMSDIEAAKKHLFIDGGENKALYFSQKSDSTLQSASSKTRPGDLLDSLSDDEYRITKPLPKPKGSMRKRQQSDSGSDYDPMEDSLYQDANFVYPRLDLSSDFDEDDFSWKPSQRNVKKKSKREKNAAVKSKLNSPQSPLDSVNPFFRESVKRASPSKPKSAGSATQPSPSVPGPQGAQGPKKDKPKKGLATAKQRLGKLLKMEKMGNRYVR